MLIIFTSSLLYIESEERSRLIIDNFFVAVKSAKVARALRENEKKV